MNIFFRYIFDYCSFFPLETIRKIFFLSPVAIFSFSLFSFCFVPFHFGKASQMINILLSLFSTVNVLLSSSNEDFNPTFAYFVLFILPASTSFIRLLQKLSSVLLRTTTAFLNFYFGFIVKNDELPFLVFRIICSIFFFITPMLVIFFFLFTESSNKNKELFRPCIFNRQNVQWPEPSLSFWVLQLL